MHIPHPSKVAGFGGECGAIVTCSIWIDQELVDAKLPRLRQHLEKLGCDMTIIATDWFLCLFSTSLPSEVGLTCHMMCATVVSCAIGWPFLSPGPTLLQHAMPINAQVLQTSHVWPLKSHWRSVRGTTRACPAGCCLGPPLKRHTDVTADCNLKMNKTLRTMTISLNLESADCDSCRPS
jgi:hypothetical protein